MRLAAKAGVVAVGVPTGSGASTQAVSATAAQTSASTPTGAAYAASVQEKVTAAMEANVIPGAIVRISSPTQGDWTGTFGTATIGQPVLGVGCRGRDLYRAGPGHVRAGSRRRWPARPGDAEGADRQHPATDPAHPESGGYGIGIAKFGPLIGHDGQIPGFMTFTGQDPATGLTITIATNLATVPSGEGSALTVLKAILPIFYPNLPMPGNPAAVPTR